MALSDRTREDARWEAIRRKMEEHAVLLRRQGAIVARMARGRRVWSVRFRDRVDGREVQRAIYLGGDDQPELLRRARELLKQFHEDQTTPEEIALYTRTVADMRAMLRRLSMG